MPAFTRRCTCLWVSVFVSSVALGCGDDDATVMVDASTDSATADSATHDAGGDARVPEDDAGDVDSGDGPSDAGGCGPWVNTYPSLGGMHVASNAGVTYNSNPPSSGPHCSSWGQYAVFSADNPLPRCNYIHNLEHGAIVILYKCEDGCEQLVASLAQVRDSIVDSQCLGAKRVILTPDADIDTTIAATGWQTTWTSDCTDAAALQSLAAFIQDNLGGAGVAPESGVCGNGSIAP